MGSSNSLVERFSPTATPNLGTIVITDKNRRLINAFIKEAREPDEFRQNGLPRRATLLLRGPSGVGKVHTAHAIANELALDTCLVKTPLIFADGENELRNLDAVFKMIIEEKAFYIIEDCFDSTFRLSLRHFNMMASMLKVNREFGQSIVVLTSTRKAVDDSPLLQATDLYMTFPMPDEAALRELFNIYLPGFSEFAESSRVVNTCMEMAYSEISRALKQVRFESVATGNKITFGQVLNSLVDTLVVNS